MKWLNKKKTETHREKPCDDKGMTQSDAETRFRVMPGTSDKS